MKTGMTSVTFRNKSAEEIVRLTQKAGLTGIEWGGDVHVPAGDRAAARKAALLTREAGLEVLSYGSYFRAQEGEDFSPVLESAIELGAPVIRMWAGFKPYEESSRKNLRRWQNGSGKPESWRPQPGSAWGWSTTAAPPPRRKKEPWPL